MEREEKIKRKEKEQESIDGEKKVLSEKLVSKGRRWRAANGNVRRGSGKRKEEEGKRERHFAEGRRKGVTGYWIKKGKAWTEYWT